jgi:chromosomal replication initiation ATPase DnaA
MKESIFNEYTNMVVDLFSITKDDLFSKTKRRDVVDARHLLFYLCHKRPMPIRYIQNFMGNNGYEVGHSTIIYGVEQVGEKVKSDPDYQSVMDNLYV